MKYFNEEGEEVTEGIFTQEDIDKAVTDAAAAKVIADEEAAATTADAVPAVPAPGSTEETLAKIQETLASLTKSNQTNSSGKFVSGLDAEKKTAFDQKYESLGRTGDYPDTPEGLEQRGSDAYQLTTGESFDHGNFNMQNLGSASGKSPVNPNTEVSEADKEIGAALGNSEEDIKKYSNKT